MPPEAARAALGLPDRALVEALARGIRGQVRLEDGYLRPAGPPEVRDPVRGQGAVAAAADSPPR